MVLFDFMLSLFLVLIVFISAVVVLTFFVWHRINFNWLSSLVFWLTFSLPFERIPSVSLGGANLRASQILTILGFYFVAILVFKKDKKILSLKLVPNFIWLVFLVILSIPSWFFVLDYSRFWITQLATFLAFGSCFLVAHFARVWRNLQGLFVSLSAVCVFGIYQFLGDLVWDLPAVWTGLRPQYTKAVFGYPRVQATAIEPLYLAGMLFWPIFLLILLLLNRLKLTDFFERKLTFFGHNLFDRFLQNTDKKPNWISESKAPKKTPQDILYQFFTKFSKIKANLKNNFKTNFSHRNFLGSNFIFSILDTKKFFGLNWLFLGLFLTVFILTFSKGGWLIFLVILFGILIFYARFLGREFWSNCLKFGILGVLGISILSSILPSLSSSLQGLGRQFVEITSGTAPTISERNQFLQVATTLLPENAILGIGSGQYGVWAKKFFGDGDGFLIVNNVYLEVWLEFGFLSFSCFLVFLLIPIWQFWQFSKKYATVFNSKNFNSPILNSQKAVQTNSDKNLTKILIQNPKPNSNANSKLEAEIEANANSKLEPNSRQSLEMAKKEKLENSKNHPKNDQKSSNFLSLENLVFNSQSQILSLENSLSNQILQNQDNSIEKRQIQTKVWQICGQSLVVAILAYYLQWLSFSPIFINPIFILIGLLLAFLRESKID